MITPMVARLVRDPFDRDGWLFEIKWDGFRAIPETDGAGNVSLPCASKTTSTNDFLQSLRPLRSYSAQRSLTVRLWRWMSTADRGSSG